MIMKDMFGKDIEVGDYVIYSKAFTSKHYEKAVVVESNDKFVRIEYLGVSTYPLQQYRMVKGKKSRLTKPEKRIMVCDQVTSVDGKKDVYQNEIERLKEEIKQMYSKLAKSLKRETDLILDNKKLQLEVDKIYDRFDILDL